MPAQIDFIPHKNKMILYENYSECQADEIIQGIKDANKIIVKQEPNSVLNLVNVKGSHYNKNVINTLKEYAKTEKGLIAKTAVVGIEGIFKIMIKGVSTFSGRNFQIFDSVNEAKDWLAQD